MAVKDDELFADEIISKPKENEVTRRDQKESAKGIALLVIAAWFIVGFLAGYTFKTVKIASDQKRAGQVVTPPPLTPKQMESGERPAGHPELEAAGQ